MAYGASVVLRLPELDQRFYAGILPYIVGSLGVVVFDIVTLLQARHYGGF